MMHRETSTPRLAAASLVLGLGLGACGGDGGNESGETGDPTGYTFATDAPTSYARVDRLGMPAVGTAVIADREGYNQGDPSADVAGDFVAEITASVEALHGALDDDIAGVGLQACIPADCVAQAAPFVVPDTLSVDLDTSSGFPNGRGLADPVIDVTLTLLLLDLAVDGQDPGTLVDVLNPAANDLPFEATFPYLAAAHAL